MDHLAIYEADKCRLLATAMRLDATRARMQGFADRLIRGAEDLERLALELLADDPGTQIH